MTLGLDIPMSRVYTHASAVVSPGGIGYIDKPPRLPFKTDVGESRILVEHLSIALHYFMNTL
jgi:hypothetical protein